MSRRSYFFLFQKKSYNLFLFYFGIVQIWLCTTIWIVGFGLRLSFYISKKVSLCSRYGFLFFCYTFTYFVRFGVIENRVTKVNAPDHKVWLFEKFIFEVDAFSYSFKIFCILLKQVVSFKKMVVLLAKLTILISWSPICIPLILLLASTKLASTSAKIMYNSMENRHLRQTPRVRVKGSDRSPFLGWVFCMHLQPCEWICLHIWIYGKQKS